MATTTTTAYLNHGRWIVDCPICNSARSLDVNTNRAPLEWGEQFVCLDCGAGPMKVAYPADGLKGQVEVAIMGRPVHAQNWNPTEKVADLLAENKTRGF